MDQDSTNYLNGILTKELAALTASDQDFLRARREYLTPEQAETFASVLAPGEAKKTKKAAPSN